ncbi:MAG: serine hydroxymethyltransferase [Aliihoeflea sp.]
MSGLARRDWTTDRIESYIARHAAWTQTAASGDIEARIGHLVNANRRIHEVECVNLNPATNVMNPRAEALLASGLGTRPSLGYPTDKYEMGLEAIEEIEVIAAALAAEIFEAGFAEIRVASGAMANLYAFMATCRPGDAIIAPPASIGGHVTHHLAGAAGLYGLVIHEAPVDSSRCTVDIAGLRELARKLRPRLITLGGSLNLFEWDVAGARTIADEVEAWLLFDAAHLCGMIAGKAWANPLGEGAHLMTMSTYKSLGGPPGGLVVTNEAELAEKLDRIAFPGLTANFDVAKSAALAISLLNWRDGGSAYARDMIETAQALGDALQRLDVDVFAAEHGFTRSHQFALRARKQGGGQAMARHLRAANILTSGIGLPDAPVEGDMNGLRLGTPEIVRFGMGADDMKELASLIARALAEADPTKIAADTSSFRARFRRLSHIRA